MGMPPSYSIEHTIDAIHNTSLPNAPSYFLIPQEAAVIEHQIFQLLELGHIQPSSSPVHPQPLLLPKMIIMSGAL